MSFGLIVIEPAMAAGVSQTLWTMDNIITLVDAAAPVVTKRGPCKKRAGISN